MWKNMDPNEKIIYQNDAKSIANERRLSFNKLSDEEKFNLTERQNLEDKIRSNRARRKVIRERNISTNRPKVPPNSFAIYVQHLFKNSPSVHSLNDANILVLNGAKSWKNLPENEKLKFMEEAKKRKEDYNLALQKWKLNH